MSQYAGNYIFFEPHRMIIQERAKLSCQSHSFQRLKLFKMSFEDATG